MIVGSEEYKHHTLLLHVSNDLHLRLEEAMVERARLEKSLDDVHYKIRKIRESISSVKLVRDWIAEK